MAVGEGGSSRCDERYRYAGLLLVLIIQFQQLSKKLLVLVVVGAGGGGVWRICSYWVSQMSQLNAKKYSSKDGSFQLLLTLCLLSLFIRIRRKTSQFNFHSTPL